MLGFSADLAWGFAVMGNTHNIEERQPVMIKALGFVERGMLIVIVVCGFLSK